MANFPTIPTVAAGRVLTANQADTSGTRTFPDLNGLTKNAGDLLIAIIAVYQSSAAAGAVFSSWGAGFTEFLDVGGTTSNMSIGAAYKVSDGTETGTFTVTQAATVTGFASMILLSIPGAHATTAPVGGAITNGTTGAADIAALNPAGWDVEDTLWIAVGASGETNASGTWTGVASAPTDYSSYVDTAKSDTSTIGECELAVAFRQNRIASENPGAFSVDTSNARNSSVLIAVRPAPYAGQVADVITFDATTVGSIPRGLVSWAVLETPQPAGGAEVTGAVVDAITVDAAPVARLEAFAKIDDPITVAVAPTATVTMFSRVDDQVTVVVAPTGVVTMFSRVDDPISFVIAPAGALTKFGTVNDPIGVAATTAAWVEMFSRVDDPINVGETTQGFKDAFSRVDDQIVVDRIIAGYAERFGLVGLPIVFAIVTQGDVQVGARDWFGAVADAILFGATIEGHGAISGQVFGAVSQAYLVSVAPTGTLSAKGAVALPIVVDRTTILRKDAVGQTTLALLFGSTTAAFIDRRGIVALPVVWDATTVGRVGHAGAASAVVLAFDGTVLGTITTHGAVVVPVAFDVMVDGVANLVVLMGAIHTGRIGYGDNGAVGDTSHGRPSSDGQLGNGHVAAAILGNPAAAVSGLIQEDESE